jgi:GNAT superfamily N-acetyltransferase
MGTATATIQREGLSDALWDELLPLLKRHWAEVAHYADVPLAPNWERYAQLEARRALRVWTVRDGGALIGYLAMIVGPHLHYDLLVANQDVLYVAPEYRRSSLGGDLMTHAETALKAEGVQLIIQHSKANPARTIAPFLVRQGYELMDHIYVKRLGA